MRAVVAAFALVACGRIDFDPHGFASVRCGFVEIRGGRQHTCARRDDGSVACWGNNEAGAVDGTPSAPVLTPKDVALPAPATQIDLGADVSCALLADGSVACWGTNASGELGDATAAAHPGIVQALPAGSAIEIAVGSSHTCARRGDGTVTCWGSNLHGQIGVGRLSAVEPPTQVPGLTGVVAIGTGHQVSCAILADSTIRCWGKNNDAQLGVGSTGDRASPIAMTNLTGAVAMSGGGRHSCVLRADHSIVCVGKNDQGQDATGDTSYDFTPSRPAMVGPAHTLVTGSRHTCALLDDGSVACWGRGADGALGNGALPSKQTLPVVVELPSVPIAIGGGYRHTCVILADGSPLCWGANDLGQLGDGTRSIVSQPTEMIAGATAITVGTSNACAMTAQGIRCWGYNGSGLLGDGTTEGRDAPVAVTLPNASAVETGGDHTCGLDATNVVWCWGSNWSSQLGTTAGGDALVPRVADKAGIGARTAVGIGSSQTCALGAGAVECWGFDYAGQLGNNATTGVGPAAAQSIATATAVFVGEQSSYALLADGTLRGWGENSDGRLGDGTTTSRSVPTPIAQSVANPRALAVAFGHSCAIDGAGAVWCWGSNDSGQLGDGTTLASPSAVRVAGLPAVTEIAVGVDHSCAVDATGAVWCWGSNRSGQLGDDTWPLRATPAIVGGLPPVVEIRARSSFTCARAADGRVLCWGSAESGQIGPIVRHGAQPIAPSCAP